MNKNRFEEDDGIYMNDIERFLPHLCSVSQNIIFVEMKAAFSDCTVDSLIRILLHPLVGQQCPRLTLLWTHSCIEKKTTVLQSTLKTKQLYEIYYLIKINIEE